MNEFIVLVAWLIVLFFLARWFVGFGVGAPFVPVRRRDLQDAFSMIRLSDRDVFIDLGAGDGRVLEAAAEKGARVIGYEINPFLCWFARRRLRRFGDRATVHARNLLDADLSSVTVVYLFGMGSVMPKIAEKLRHLPQPVTVISIAFDLPGFVPMETRGVVKKYQLG